MRQMQNEELEASQGESEITLGMASLLGIFFGLVLVCGVFFGFGYSIGRRGQQPVPAAGAEAAPAATSAASLPEVPLHVAAKPSAQQLAATEPAGQDAVTGGAVETAAGTPIETKTIAPRLVAAPAVAQQRMVTNPAPAAVLQRAALTTGPASAQAAQGVQSGPVMVQIAAVNRQEDADVLVSALRQRGYAVTSRSEPQDKFIHVQVGPFATRDEARQMRAKLLTDGYNAILKP